MYLKFKNLYFPTYNLRTTPDKVKKIKINEIPKKDFFTSIKHNGVIIFKKKNLNIIDCKNCQFIHVAPRPSEKFLTNYYKKKYYQLRKPNYFKDQKKEIIWWKKIFNIRLIMFEKFLKRKGKILDIGCGPGYFLSEAKKRGWDVYGIEPSKQAADYAKKLKLKINCGSYENENNYFNKKFDVIYSHGVIEHLSDPTEYFSKIKKFLNKKALLYSSTANEFNLYQLLFFLGKNNKKPKNKKVSPWFLVPPEHMNYFNHKSIKKLYERFNFKIINQTSTFPIEIFLLSGLDYVKNKKKGKLVQQMRENFEEYLFNNFKDHSLNQLYIDSFLNNYIGRQTETLGILKN